jgi:MoxR-like ATPase
MSTTGADDVEIRPVIDAEGVLALQRMVREVPVADADVPLRRALVRATRPGEPGARRGPALGALGRGSARGQALILAAKARALLDGRFTSRPTTSAASPPPVLRHRVLLNFHAEADGVRPDDVVGAAAGAVRPPAQRARIAA